jgi:hypothetical protein
MSKRVTKRGRKQPRRAKESRASGRSVKRQKPAKRASGKPKRVKPTRKTKPAPRRPATPARAEKAARLNRRRRTLDEVLVPTPPSSLNMDRRGSAARTGRAGMAEYRLDHAGMTDVTVGDADVNAEDAYFTGDEAPGGDNPTPDQDIVDDIGKALGVQYQDDEELKAGDKVADRDKHRWELDPASSEDYKNRSNS